MTLAVPQLQLGPNSEYMLRFRYLAPGEEPAELFQRVATNLASVESSDVDGWAARGPSLPGRASTSDSGSLRANTSTMSSMARMETIRRFGPTSYLQSVSITRRSTSRAGTRC